MKKAISVLLCLAMLISTLTVFGFAKTAAPAETAADTETTETPKVEQEYPIVFVTGIGQSYSYLYATPEDAKADAAENSTDRAIAKWNLFCNDFSFALKDITTYVSALRIVGTLLLTIVTGHNFVSKDACDDLVTELFRYNTVDENGNLPETVVTPRCDYPVSRMTEEQRDNFYRTIPCEDVIGDIGEDMLYCFNYSAFSFTYRNSDNLNTFINEVVLPQTGKDKVVLIPMSMGASVVSAYLQDYGKDGKVARVVSIVGAWYGSDVIADLVEQKYAPDAPEKLYNGIVADLIGEPWGYLVNGILRIFPKATLRSVIDEILNSVIENLVLKTPSLMVMVPYERYPAVRAARLEGNKDLAYVMEITDKFYDAQRNLKTYLKELNENYGVDFYYIAGYGLEFGGYSSDYEFFKFLESANTTNSDEIIQISSTATGATSVTAGKQFDAGYLASHDAKYITPDKSVDVSTCLFPDRVWLFDRQKHELENNNTALKLAFDIALGNVTSTADCEDTYPQFNDSRDLKRLKRSYIPDLERWLESNTPTAAQQKLIDENNAAANEMMSRTINDRKADDEIIENYRKMLVTLGIYEESEEKEDGLTSVLKALNDFNVRVFGFKGFIDIFSR